MSRLAAKHGVEFNSMTMEHQHATAVFEVQNYIAFVSKNDIAIYKVDGQNSLTQVFYSAARMMMQKTGCKRSHVEGKFKELAVEFLSDATKPQEANKDAN